MKGAKGGVGANAAANIGYEEEIRDDLRAPCKAVVAVVVVADELWYIGRAPTPGLPWAKISEW